MKTTHPGHKIPRHLATIAAFLILATGAMAWNASGVVKNASGTPLKDVAVSVKDSAGYKATTGADGAFTLSVLPVSVKERVAPRAASVEIVADQLIVHTPHEGWLSLSLVDASGRPLWNARIQAKDGLARTRLPSGIGHGALFLRIRHGQGTTLHAVGTGEAGALVVRTSARAVATYPTLVFKKAGYRDTSLAMSSATQTGIVMTMTDTAAAKVCALPAAPKWQSSGILVSPKTDANHPIVAVKDPTIQFHNGKWLVYATTYSTGGTTTGWNMEFLTFSDFSQAAAAPQVYMDQTPGFGGYKCAPELFYFAPKKIWYLIWQQQDPAYSTTTTPENPKSWSAPKPFYAGGLPKPANWGTKGWLPIDYWPICDASSCYLFFTGDDGNVFRAKTTLANFPAGFDQPVVVKTLGKDVIFEGGSHYKVKGTADTYLHLMEGMGSTGRYFSAWTSQGLEGAWKDYRVGQSTPFARSTNTTYAAGVADWTNDISHGELLRDNPDQTQTVDPCSLRLLYQGMDPTKGGVDYGLLPYRLGLLTAQ